MTEMQLLTLICPPGVDEKVQDLLLVFCPDALFTSGPVAAHGVAPEALSATEQVMGSSRMTRLQILLAPVRIAPLMDALRRDFGGVGMQYWLSPVLDAGELR